MKTSVVITTYNGEKYIVEQLDSIVNQELQPDEVIISDDLSQDNTSEIVSTYIDKHNLEKWKLYVNKENKGYARNFIETMDMASGDVFFLGDQDDIWNSDKLKIMTDIMESMPEISLLASEYTPFYSDGSVQITDRVIGQMKNNGSVEAYHMDHLFFHVQRPGCVFCVRGSFFRKIRKYWREGYIHDAFLWHFAAITGGLYFYNSSTIQFRRHDSNASTRPIQTREDREEECRLSRQCSSILMKTLDDDNLSISGDVQRYIEENDRFLEDRLDTVMHKKMGKAIVMSMKYKNYYLTVKSRFSDIYLLIFKR